MHINGGSKRESPPKPKFHVPDFGVVKSHSDSNDDRWLATGSSTVETTSSVLGATSPATCTSSPPSSATVPGGFSSKRLNWTRRMVITKQPASESYKNEGGKANALEVEVTLVEYNEQGEPARANTKDFIDIPLRILLFFEYRKRVDDTDQEIFRFVGNEYDSVVIRASTRKALVQFRLEKVIRRKDGQRFKLCTEVDQEKCTANVADLHPVFTNAIFVLSKRKYPISYGHELLQTQKLPSIDHLVRLSLVIRYIKFGAEVLYT
ncbi:hypothetical protein PsorP6_010093 [Peronosclerospora sorghi]|uniref:Uncharacterized protein n=1 Tax=Peronosclerospora sorghi TaxID=230839 RepID=A0ACC0VXA0_9STRA|nr:hypothetical protein PsorP6_010093 [Peronosclerospora sorghi]